MSCFRFLFLWLTLLLLTGLVRAEGWVSASASSQTVRIKFPEPVAAASGVVWDDDEKKPQPEQFRIIGDSRHVPEACWTDQDELKICFPAGTSCKTEYKLVFREGVSYLSGKPLQKREYIFRCPPCALAATPVATAQWGAVLVTPKVSNTVEARQFSEQSAVHYEFRRVKRSIWSGDRYLGRRVAATVEPARVCDGVMEESLHRLAAAGQKVWGKLKADSPLPGHVLVRPAEELDFDETWVLCYRGAEGSGIVDAQKGFDNQVDDSPWNRPATQGVSADFHPLNELFSGLSVSEAAENAGEVEMQLFFSQPLPEKSLPELFSRLEFSIDGKGTTENSKEGRKLTVNDKVWLMFRYAGTLPYAAHGVSLSEGSSTKLAYQAAGMASGIRIRVSGVLPAVVDVAVPQGTAAANGAVLREKHVHRIALNPAWPQVQADSQKPMVLPLKAAHKLRLPTANLSAVEATLCRVHPNHFAEVMRSDMYDSRKRDDSRCKYRIHRKRKSAGLPAQESIDSLKKEWESAEDALEYDEEVRERCLADAVSYPAHRFDLKGSALFRSSELVLDLDALAGEKLPAGLYLVTLKVTPNAHVQYALSLQEQRADALNYELDIPVLVTDLNVICSAQGVLVTRFSDGSVVSGAELLEVTWNKAREEFEEKPLPDCSGVAFVKGESQKIIARSGQDMAWGVIPLNREPWMRYREDSAASSSARLFLFADRPLYRPGDTVHVRGLVRNFRHGKTCFVPQKKVQVKLSRPDGESLLEREVPLSEFGGFELDAELPEGEEDVTGNYELTVCVGTAEEKCEIPCQVARRNAFEATLTVDVPKVAPQKMTLRVQADDYSGVPLAGAGTELRVVCNSVEEKHQAVTDSNGTAVLELPMKEEWLRQGKLTVSGSICNDREEYVVFPEQEKEFSPADFRIRCEHNRIYLDDAVTSAPLAREQRVQVRLLLEGMKAENPRACFTVMNPVKKALASVELIIPANSRQGVPLPQKIRQAMREHADKEEYHPYLHQELELTGRDAAGREAYGVASLFCASDKQPELHMELTPENGKIRVQFCSPHKGMAHFFIGCGERLRHVQKRVEEGEQHVELPLLRHEEGTVSVSLVLPECGRNAGTAFCTDSDSCFVPPVRMHLDVALNLPQSAVRPGQKIQLSGQVLAEGTPAQAEVTLYAVDEGMLSLCLYEKPDPEKFFASGEALTFCPKWEEPELLPLSDTMMEAIWQGDMAEGESRSLSPHYRKKFAATKSVKSSSRYGIMTGGLRSGSGMLETDELPPWLLDTDSDAAAEPAPVAPICYSMDGTDLPRLRSNFEPVAVWKAALRTDAEGRFSAEAELPDTLTTYCVFAVAADRSGARFGSAEGTFVVNLPVMITPGMPLFMSTGDVLQLPLSIANATEQPGSWTVSLEGCDTPQQIELPAGGSGTLFFTVAPEKEGECCLQWKAEGAPGKDAVQGTCQVRFPAPLLKEIHRPELQPGQEPLRLASLLAPEIAESSRAELELLLSASPVLHLRGCVDFLLNYPYGCTEQRASALMPWLLYEELSPFCPKMSDTSPEKVKNTVEREISALFARQCEDGGLGYWQAGKEGCAWASAHAAMVLTVAAERGYALPGDKMKRLLRFVEKQDEDDLQFCGADLAAARALGEHRRLRRALKKSCEGIELLKQEGCISHATPYEATLRFLNALYANEKELNSAFRDWLRTVGRDYRHGITGESSLMLLALHDFLRRNPLPVGEVTAVTQGERYTLKREPLRLTLPQVTRPAELPTTLTAEGGTVYALLHAKAQPEQKDFPGVTEKGLQVTRLYEVKGADGKWQKAPATLRVGDVVRVTLTCAKVSDEMHYLVLEDYLPACMEAINPEVPSQAAGLEFVPWSSWFDHREYLADRVRGFCTRWSGRDLLNMTYFARVKRAGTSTAPPAQAQLMYEPQTYGLSPNTKVVSESAE